MIGVDLGLPDPESVWRYCNAVRIVPSDDKFSSKVYWVASPACASADLSASGAVAPPVRKPRRDSTGLTTSRQPTGRGVEDRDPLRMSEVISPPELYWCLLEQLLLYQLSPDSCMRLRAERRNHVWSYDFVENRTHPGSNRMLSSAQMTGRRCAIYTPVLSSASQYCELPDVEGNPSSDRSNSSAISGGAEGAAGWASADSASSGAVEA